MNNSAFHNIFIVGAGQMGHGIAQVIACSGREVTLYDVDHSALERAREKICWSLERLHSKGRIKETAELVLSRLRTTTTLGDASSADLVIEAAPEREEIKRSIYEQLATICPPPVVFATNTSAIPISRLAASTGRPSQFCGLHFFNPVPMMSLVEVVRGDETSDATLASLTEFVRQIGKDPVLVRKDKAGFIVNRILGAAMGEAIRLLEGEMASAAEIDKAMRLGCGWKMGPLETADLAGLDIVLNMFDAMQKEEPDPVVAAPDLLRQHVAQGNLGRKSGQGFYPYPSDPS